MLSLGPGVQIVLATSPVDLRCGHDGLATLGRTMWKDDPYSGTLFVFLGRRMDRVKILFFHAGGFTIYYPRLERGRFTMPRIPAGATRVDLDATSLAMLLDGVDLRVVRRAPRWEPARAKKTYGGDRHFARIVIKAARWFRPMTTSMAAPGAILQSTCRVRSRP